MARILAPLIVVALVLQVTVATAGWGGPGTWEPDTAEDVEHGSMYLTPDVSGDDGVRRIYFNAFPTAPQSSINPNVGATGSRLGLLPAVHYRAILGLWKDCNADGYMGLAESALQEYRKELLPNRSVCPDGTRHNSGGFVSEVLMIGMIDPCEKEADPARRASECPGVPAYVENERAIYSPGARVWGDVGLPGESPPGTCPDAPLPRGTTSGTGALLRYGDCRVGYAVAREATRADSQLGLGMGFDDPANPQRSESPLNQHFPVSLFGNPTTGEAGVVEQQSTQRAFTAWDCSRPRGTHDVRDPTGPADKRGSLSGATVSDPSGNQLTGRQAPVPVVGVVTLFVDHDGDPSTPGVLRVWLTDDTGSYARVPSLAPSVDDPTGSWWDAAEAVADGSVGDCDAETTSAMQASYPHDAVEGANEPVPAGRKDRNTWVFSFYDGHRGFNERVDPHAGSETWPSDAGLMAYRHRSSGPLWSALAPTTPDTPLIQRAELKPAGARHATFYASLDMQDMVSRGYQIAAAGSFTYGSEACATIGPGAAPANGWICDTSRWWRDADGSDAMPRYTDGAPLGAVPGDAYHLRDVDCEDGALLAGVPVYASLTFVSEEGGCPVWPEPPGPKTE